MGDVPLIERQAVCPQRQGWKRIARSEARTMSGQPDPEGRRPNKNIVDYGRSILSLKTSHSQKSSQRKLFA